MEKRVSELTIDDLRFFKYPNLMAEVKKTTYSICTIADHMGLPRPYRKENDPETWDKLTGKTEILTGEASEYGAIIEAVYSIKDPEKLELIERFVRRLSE